MSEIVSRQEAGKPDRAYESKRVVVTRIELDRDAIDAILLKEFDAPPKAWVEWDGGFDAAVKWINDGTEEPT